MMSGGTSLGRASLGKTRLQGSSVDGRLVRGRDGQVNNVGSRTETASSRRQEQREELGGGVAEERSLVMDAGEIDGTTVIALEGTELGRGTGSMIGLDLWVHCLKAVREEVGGGGRWLIDDDCGAGTEFGNGLIDLFVVK
ncbi:hypothetical protein M0R45_008970 [Rubus argutus]|uniref:Uncharacterized protein n=1 Tax=Rubus argutus TaxID=59490 RepID=A0AAW1Y4K4_RUBAR